MKFKNVVAKIDTVNATAAPSISVMSIRRSCRNGRVLRIPQMLLIDLRMAPKTAVDAQNRPIRARTLPTAAPLVTLEITLATRSPSTGRTSGIPAISLSRNPPDSSRKSPTTAISASIKGNIENSA